MKTQPSPHSMIFGALVLCLLSYQTSQSQVVVSSSVSYNPTTNQVTGTVQTTMDYNTALYYQAYAEGALYVQGNSQPISSGSSASIPGYNLAAVVVTQASASPYKNYTVNGNHLVGTLYQNQNWNGAICGNYYRWNDVYGYIWRGYYNYGASATIYPTFSAACLNSPYIAFGTTTHSLQTPPSLSITNPRVSGNLKGTTQNVLLASPAGLQATVTPAGLGGNFVWSFSGPFTQDSSSQDNSYRSIFWTQPGTYAATVTYSGNGFSVSGTVNVQVRVPTLISFSGVASDIVVDRGSNCGAVFDRTYLPFGTTVSIGCDLLQDGMRSSATATIPNVEYLSNPAETGIIFKQLVNPYRKRNNRGRFECLASRNPQSDPSTGWQIDSQGGEFYSPGSSFTNATTLTHKDSDVPASAVSGRHNDGGASFEYDAFLADDQFETYVYYFTGGNSSFPSFAIPLHVADAGCSADRFDCGVDLLAWRFSTQVHYDSSVQNSQYRSVGSPTTGGPISATRRSSVRSYSLQQTNQYSLCQGAPEVTNPIDGTRFFVLQLYWDVLNRTADQNGWDGWTTIISRCGFDTACINSNRIAVARGFLESPENFANNPALANPGTHTYNREYVRLCYLKFLGRPPEPPGWDGWTNYIDGHPGEYSNLVGGFINSGEYRGRFGTP